jgi:hypothetical protein
VQQIEHFVPLVDQVLSQARRRVLQSETVLAKEKLLSLFELHTASCPAEAREGAGAPRPHHSPGFANTWRRA